MARNNPRLLPELAVFQHLLKRNLQFGRLRKMCSSRIFVLAKCFAICLQIFFPRIVEAAPAESIQSLSESIMFGQCWSGAVGVPHFVEYPDANGLHSVIEFFPPIAPQIKSVPEENTDKGAEQGKAECRERRIFGACRFEDIYHLMLTFLYATCLLGGIIISFLAMVL